MAEPLTRMSDALVALEPAESHDPLRGIARYGAWHMAAILVPGLYAVLLAAYLLRTLGPDAYGVWAATMAAVGWLTLLDAGLSATTTRATARAVAGDRQAVEQVRTAYAVYAALGVAGTLAGALLAALIPVVLGLTGDAARDAWLVGAFLAVDLGIVIATAGWMGTLRGSRRFREMLVVNVVQVAVAGGALILLLPPAGLVGAAAAQPLGRLAGRVLAAALLTRQLAWFRARPRLPGWGEVRTLSAFSLPILAMQAAAQLGIGTDVIIVGAAAGPTAAGLYAAGSQLARYVGFFIFPALGVLLPSFSAAVLKQPDVVPRLLVRSVLLSGLIGGAVYGGMALQAVPLLELWSAQSSPLSTQVLILYATAWMIVTPTHVMTLMLVASGRHRVIGAIVLGEALLNLALSVVLVPLIGPVGAAVASFALVLADDILIIPAVTARSLEVAWPRLLGAALGGAAGGGGVALLVDLVPVAGTAGLLVRGVLGAAALAVAIIVLVPGARGLASGVAVRREPSAWMGCHRTAEPRLCGPTHRHGVKRLPPSPARCPG